MQLLMEGGYIQNLRVGVGAPEQANACGEG